MGYRGVRRLCGFPVAGEFQGCHGAATEPPRKQKLLEEETKPVDGYPIKQKVVQS